MLTVGMQSFLGEYLVDWPSLMPEWARSRSRLCSCSSVSTVLVSGMTQGALAN
jgi:hypothetical protein